MVGMFIGGLLIGRLCDLFGRRFGIMFSILIATTAHFGAGWSQDYYAYVIARFLTGIGN